MSLIPHIQCDVCKKEILAGAPPHQTRQEYERQLDNDIVEVLLRRDVCEDCARRIKQAVLGPLKGCEWILDGFKVVRK